LARNSAASLTKPYPYPGYSAKIIPPRLSEEPGPNETAVDTSTLTLGPGFEDQVKWRLGRAPEASKPTTCHYVPQALLTRLSAKSKTDLLR